MKKMLNILNKFSACA